MGNTDKIQKLLSRENGIITASKAAKAGFHRQELANFVKAGILEHIERGIYSGHGELDDSLYCLQQRAKKIIYSHETALFLHRMTSRTPNRYSITVPASYKTSTSLKRYCKIYYIKQDLIGLGKIKTQSGMGNTIITYNIERTICDIIRSRNRIDGQIVIEAIKNYVKRKDMNLHRLYNYAGIFRVKKILNNYMEVLL